MPSIEDIRLTIAALDHATFGEVARIEHVSQSTVSRAVKRVEAAIGFELFTRQGRLAVRRSDAEPQVVRLRTVHREWQLLSIERSPARSLSIFCTVTASQAIVPELLASFRQAHPDVHLDLHTGPAHTALDAALHGEVDAAIAPLPRSLPRSLVSLPVADMPMQAVSSTDYAPVDREWSNVRVIVPRPGVTRDIVDQWCRKHLHHGFSIQECDGHEEVIALAALGSGIGIVPALVIEASALRNRLITIQPPADLPTMQIALCARRGAVTKDPLSQLWSMLRK